MVTLQQLVHYLEEFLQADAFEDYCPNGLQVQGKETVETAATAVSANLETIEEAAARGVDALIVHHGLFWKGDPYPITGVKKKKLSLLLEYQISLLAYHLPLDAHEQVGNNWCAARDLGWSDLAPFTVSGVPIGVKGSLKPTSAAPFQESLENYYDHPAHAALGGPDTLRSAVLVSGGAYRSLPLAAQAGADSFITGNFDEPAYHQALEEGIHFFALGHHATERVGPRALGKHLEEKLSLTTPFIDIRNPF